MTECKHGHNESECPECLEARVMAFRFLELPGQPQMMHMGTANLVEDLWREIKRLRGEVSKAQAQGEKRNK